MVNFVLTTQCLEINGVDISQLNFSTGEVIGKTKNIPCVGTNIVGAFWHTPIVQGAQVTKYEYAQAVDAVKPTPDSVKVLRLKNIRDTYDIAILDTDFVGVLDEFATLCDGLGGSLATMPTVVIPFPIFQNGPSSTPAAGDNIFTFPFPANPAGLEYNIPWPWFDGVAPGTPYAGSGITTAADFVTWANANWDAYGTWTSSGDIVHLESTSSDDVPITKAGLGVSLVPAAWCLDLTSVTGYTVNGLKFGTGSILTFPAFTLTSTNMQTLINAIGPLFEDGATLTVSGTHKINIVTVQATPKIYQNTTLKLTAASGVC